MSVTTTVSTTAVKVEVGATYDAIIVGGGPAGLSAALSMARMRLRSIVFDSGEYRNKLVDEMHNVFSRDSEKPTEFLRIGSQQLDDKYSSFVTRRTGTTVGTVVRLDRVRIDVVEVSGVGTDQDIDYGRIGECDGFSAVDAVGNTIYGRKLVLATGTEDELPPIDGIAENWPDHIFQCLFCDGFETYEAQKPTGILFTDPLSLMLSHVAFMARRHTHPSQPVTVYTNGVPIPKDESIQKLVKTLKIAGFLFDSRPVIKLVNRGHGAEHGMDVHLGSARPTEPGGDVVNVAFLLIRPAMRNRSDHLISQLGLTRHDPASGATGGEVSVRNAFGGSSLPGCFVVGDAIQPMTKQIVVAMSSGALAGAAVVAEILGEQKAEFEKLAAST